MNENCLNNDVTTDKHSRAEQQPHINNQQHENSTENQSNPARSTPVINKMKKIPMNPTPLYISFLFSRSS
jgi:hypothetical protein